MREIAVPAAKFMRFGLHAFLAFALLLPIAVTPLAAQTRQTMDHDDESGVEDEEAKFPPMRVNPEVFNAADEVFVSIARKIEDGTATMPERRTYWALYRQYYPFTPESRPPANWRLKAWQQAATLDPAAVAPRMLSMASKSNSTAAARITPSAVVDYLWSGVGQAAPWYQGQPPSNDARTATPDWGSGRATAVWVNPFNKSDVLVGTACGGVWKTTKMSATKDDVNATWTPLTDFAPSLSVGSLTAQVSPLDGNRLGPNTKIWVGTGEGNFGGGQVEGIGVLKSVDGGATWQVRQIPWTLETTGFPMLDRTSIRRIVVDPRNTNNLWAAADGGLFRSNDAGDSWRLVATAPYYRKYGDCFGVYWQDVVIDDTAPAAGAPSYVYAAFSRTGNSGCSALSREDSGVYRSKDDGATWESISIAPANCPSTLAAPAVARVAGTLPAGTYNYRFTAITGGVESGASFASADLAVVANSQINVSWTAVPGATAYNVYGRDTGAGTGNAFYFIGTTNTTSFSDTGAVTPDVTRPAPMARGYQCVGSGFAAGGLTNTTTVAGNIGRITLTQAPQNKKHLYVQIQSVAANTPSLGIWETTDATAATVAWTARNSATNYTGGQGWYAMVGAVNPSAEAQVIVGGLDMYISANNATTLNQTSSWTGWGSTTYAHADQHHVTWVKGSVPKDDGTTDALDWIFLVNDGGFLIGTVNSTAANGVTWATNNRGMMTGQSYGIGQSGTQANAVHLGNQDNGEPKATLTAGNVTTWWESRGGDGGFADTLRTNDARALQEYVYGGIYYTTNMAYTNTVPTWSCIGGFGGCTALCNGSCVPDNAMEFIAPLTLDRSTTTIRAYTGTRFVYRNTNTFTGGTWVVYSPDLTTTNNANDIVHIHSANNNGVAGTLFASTINGKIWKSVNATCDTANCATWTNLTTATLPARSCNWVETDPNNAMRVYAAFGGFNTGHIFRSIDGGTTWTDVSGLLPNEPFDTIAVDPSSVNRVFVASDSGVFVNEDAWNTNTWMRVNNGVLPLGKLYTLAYSPANNKLRAVTHGRGLWELTVSANSACGGNVPAAPTGVTTTSSSGQVTISWTAVAGAASYKVYRVAGSACPTNDIGNVIGSGITGTSYVDTTSCTVGNFAYRVVAVNAANCESPASSCVTATIAAPVAPATLTATAGVPGQINLTWSAVTGASRYEVFRYNNSTCPAPNNGVQIASNVSGTTYSDTGLTNGTPYAYFVRVQTSCPNAPFSSCATATPSACTPPAAPASVSATPSAPNQITVTWSTVAGASSYKVYRATGACTALDAAYTLLVSGVAGTSYNDTTATFGNRYSYKVISTATCDSALSASCAWAEAYGDCVLAPNFGGVDTVITTAGSTCGIDLTWAAGTTNCPGTGSISYTVYRSTTSGFAPGAATRIVSGVSGTTYTDSNQLQAGVTYYYVVRAVDSRNNVEDLNTAEDTATAQVSCTAAPNDVQVFTVTATGAAAATSGQNVLQWVNPASGAPGTTVRVNFRTDTYPTSPADPAATVLFTGRPVTFGAKDSFTHSGLTIGTTYYYAIWVQY